MKRKLPLLPIAAALLVLCQQASASLDIRFVESAPKDWFSVTNQSECTLAEFTLTIDLAASAGGLIFDTTATGAGVEVFQPFQIRSGELSLLSAGVDDGANRLSIVVRNLQPSASASFTIDVDDTLTVSELGMIRVSGAEISGGTVTVESANNPDFNGAFDNTGKLRLPAPQCL